LASPLCLANQCASYACFTCPSATFPGDCVTEVEGAQNALNFFCSIDLFSRKSFLPLESKNEPSLQAHKLDVPITSDTVEDAHAYQQQLCEAKVCTFFAVPVHNTLDL